ncbi:MAG: hypothetical protein M1308_17435 [Actinobacteria bacterium]|nr:hypothetical protein [Actinomycetota bacterium]
MSFDLMLHNIEKVWPEDRIAKSKRRLLQVWNKKLPGDRIPFVFERIPDENGVNTEILEAYGYSMDVNLYFQLYQLEKRAMLDDDYIPSLYAGYRQSMIPSGFGAEETIKANATQYWSNPILKKPEDICKLEKFSSCRKNSTISLLFENMKYFRKMTKGLLPLHIVDPQDAMANASTLMDVNDYFVALYTHPEEIHYLHEICNRAIIEFVNGQIEIAEGDYIPMNTFWFAWIPKGEGIGLSIDLLSMVAPDNVEEFVLPYLNKISNYYNGVLLHSCGKWNHNMESIKKTEKLKGIDFGVTETRIEDAYKIFGSSICYALHNSYVAVHPLKVQNQEKYIENVAEFIKKNNLPAQVQIFMPLNYNLKQAMELNKLALKHFTF